MVLEERLGMMRTGMMLMRDGQKDDLSSLKEELARDQNTPRVRYESRRSLHMLLNSGRLMAGCCGCCVGEKQKGAVQMQLFKSRAKEMMLVRSNR